MKNLKFVLSYLVGVASYYVSVYFFPNTEIIIRTLVTALVLIILIGAVHYIRKITR